MNEDAILALLRQHFGDDDSLYLAPTIPQKREAGARRAHVAHLPKDERILALYDDTVFGSGENGFVVTAHRLCWKNIGGEARSIEWRYLEPDSVIPDGRNLMISGLLIEISGAREVIGAAADAFYVLAVSARIRERRPSNAPTTPPPMEAISYESYIKLTSETDLGDDEEDEDEEEPTPSRRFA